MAFFGRQAASLPTRIGPDCRPMSRQSYAYGTCVAKDGAGVLLIGPPGSGKSDLALRLLYQGFQLIADDQVAIEDGIAKPPAALAGLLEVRGLGIVRFAHMAEAR